MPVRKTYRVETANRTFRKDQNPDITIISAIAIGFHMEKAIFTTDVELPLGTFAGLDDYERI